MSSGRLVLFESSLGFAVFTCPEEIAWQNKEILAAYKEFGRLSRDVKKLSFRPFKSMDEAVEAARAIAEGNAPDSLISFLDTAIPADGRGSVQLCVADASLGTEIQKRLSIRCVAGENVLEAIRAIRQHFPKYVSESLSATQAAQADAGLGHAYSRSKIKFNVHRSDNMIIQAIAVLDNLEKYINTFAMRVKEWYSWHFPELSKVVADPITYARVAHYLKQKSKKIEEDVNHKENLVEVCKGELTDDQAEHLLELAKHSMGADLSDTDMVNIDAFCRRVIGMGDYRNSMKQYLEQKIGHVCPNLGELMGNTVAARLISHAGSLNNLAKCPASTVQILGAEKALFRALKTGTNTPKYGLIFKTSYIGKASKKCKGKVSRYLANKASIASRIDAFSDEPSNIFGVALRKQVEDRCKYYEDGGFVKKNIEVMEEALGKLAEANKRKAEDDAEGAKKKKKKKSGKKGGEPSTPAAEPAPAAEGATPGTGKKKKKKKKTGSD